ncbi:MAG: DNA primase [Saccharofermentanales bacterium]
MIPQQVIEEVKARNELVAVVEQYVRLDKRSGSNFFGLCPFHTENTPSFSVSPAKQIYYCFGCHKGGDVVRFIMEIEKLNYPQAVRMLAERAGVTIPEPDDEAYRKRSELNKQLYAINLEAARFFYHGLNSEAGKDCRSYLKNRALSTSTIRRFGLGYADDSWDSLYKHLLGKNFPEDILMRSGLFRRGKNNQVYDLFRDRLIFPILDVIGRVIAFGGRVLDDSLPKYINSPETPVYTKGRHLFGLNLAKNCRAKTMVVVEGYMDAITLHQADVPNTVAALGTALTENQAQVLRKFTESVIIAYDSDAAGQAAALRSMDVLGAKGIKVTVLQIPGEKDPDDYIRRNGPERFHALLDKALPLLDYKLLVARKNHTSDGELDILAYQDAACRILAQEANAIVRELYSSKLAEELNTSTESVLREVERRFQNPDATQQNDQLRQRLQSKAATTALAEAANGDSATREELSLLCMLAADPDLYEKLDPRPQQSDFSEGAMQDIAGYALELAGEKRLDTSVLVGLGEQYVVSGQPLPELLAQTSMRLDVIFGRQDLLAAAAEQHQRQRIKRLREHHENLNNDLLNENEPEQQEILKTLLLDVTQQLIDLKQKSEKP